MHQLTTVLATSKPLFPLRLGNYQSVRSSVPVVSRWLWPDNRIFLELDNMVVRWSIVAFLRCNYFRKATEAMNVDEFGD